MGRMLTLMTLRGTLAQIRHVAPVPPAAAQGLVARVYRQVQRDFGMLAPPVSLHAPAPGPLAACWLMLRETLIATGLASRAAKEAVAVAVSSANTCPYCVDVHLTALHGLVRRRDAADLTAGLADGAAAEPVAATAVGSVAATAAANATFAAGPEFAAGTEPGLRALVAWARASGTRPQARPHRPPFPVEYTPELVGVAVCFQYLNRMVNVFLDPSPIPPGVPAPVRGRVQQVIGRLMAPIAGKAREPGASLDLLPAAPLPGDLSWAAANATVAGAFARAAAAVETAGARAVPPAVRALVSARLAGWDGRPAGLALDWVDEAVAGLATGDRAAGRLALLTAFASYRVGDAVIQALRDRAVDDETLVSLASWASMAAARRIGGWYAAGGTDRLRYGTDGDGAPRTVREHR